MIRGFAILLMFIYHFSWDLTYFRFADFGIFSDPLWIWFARFIAGLILLVVGMGQAISFENSLKNGFRAKTFFKRLVIIASSAAAVSIGTYLIDPATYVYFGVLHHITLATILLTLALYLPTSSLLILAVASFAAPQFFTHEIFSAEWLWWLGLTPVTPATIDYVPLLPWFGVSLIGAIMAREMRDLPSLTRILAWQPTHALGHLVYFAGRHSLVLYMVHQPILFGGVYLAYSLLT